MSLFLFELFGYYWKEECQKMEHKDPCFSFFFVTYSPQWLVPVNCCGFSRCIIAYRLFDFFVHITHLWLMTGNEKLYITLKNVQCLCVLLSQWQNTHKDPVLLFAGDLILSWSLLEVTQPDQLSISPSSWHFIHNTIPLSHTFFQITSFHLSPSYFPFPSADIKAFGHKGTS